MSRARLHVSLFSGAGGLDLAVEEMFGATTLLHCESDPAAQKVLAAHWPEVLLYEDIRSADWTQVRLQYGRPYVVSGGFPCQDVSAAGRRAGLSVDTRSGLWLEMAEAINQLRPQWVVIENVRGLLSGYAYRAMEPDQDGVGNTASRPVLRAAGAVLGDLADLGYDAIWCTVSAASIGAPHHRKRVFILAADTTSEPWSFKQRDSRSSAADSEGDGRDEGWPESAGLVGRPHAAIGSDADGRVDLLPTPSVADGVGGHLTRSGARGNELLLPGVAKAYAEGALLPTPAARDGKGEANRPGRMRDGRPRTEGDNSLPDAVTLLPTPKASDGERSDCAAERVRRTPSLVSIEHYLPTPTASDATGGGAHPDTRHGHSRQLIDYALLDGSSAWGKYAPAIRRWESLTRTAPSPTEPNSKGNPRLAAPFSEWMMGWPLGWVTDITGISRSHKLRIIGNGVVPQQANAALRFLLSVAEVAA